jgi:hypothetical protein
VSWRALYWGCVVMLVITLALMVVSLLLGNWLTAAANAATSVAFVSIIYVARTNVRSGK